MKISFSKFLFLMTLLLAGCQTDDEMLVVYPTVEIPRFTLEEIETFPSGLKECSGLCNDNGMLLAINDGGNGASIFGGFPTEMDISEQIFILGATNVDWEAIACTEGEVIVGDFGNNFGSREDLLFYHLSKPFLEVERVVPFSYPDQNSFDNPNHNFDCEAFIILNDHYYLFTKNRGNDKSNLYTAPLYSSELTFRDSISVPAAVTDACYHEDSGKVILLCNEKKNGAFESYLLIVEINAQDEIEILEQINLEVDDQLEAITGKAGEEFYLGSEKESGHGGKLYLLSISKL